VQLHLIVPEEVSHVVVSTARDTTKVVEAKMEEVTITTRVVHKEGQEPT
jgi:hypothetical protein